MRLETDSNQIFDDTHPDCTIKVERLDGRLWAYIQCLDWHPRNAKPYLERYCGEFSWDNHEGSILQILATGGKW